jgi:hypothetical protein
LADHNLVKTQEMLTDLQFAMHTFKIAKEVDAVAEVHVYRGGDDPVCSHGFR